MKPLAIENKNVPFRKDFIPLRMAQAQSRSPKKLKSNFPLC